VRKVLLFLVHPFLPSSPLLAFPFLPDRALGHASLILQVPPLASFTSMDQLALFYHFPPIDVSPFNVFPEAGLSLHFSPLEDRKASRLTVYCRPAKPAFFLPPPGFIPNSRSPSGGNVTGGVFSDRCFFRYSFPCSYVLFFCSFGSFFRLIG